MQKTLAALKNKVRICKNHLLWQTKTKLGFHYQDEQQI